MGIPFNSITETYLEINEVRLNPKNNYVTYSQHRITDQLVSTRHKGAVAKKVKADGIKTKLPKTHFFGALLLRNEILGCVAQASDKYFLLRNMRKEYPDWSKSASDVYLKNFSDKRNSYITGNLYASQVLPPLYCWYWNNKGYIRHPTLTSQLISFQYCKRQLKQEQFADPRFFTVEELNELRTKQSDNDRDYINWHVPSIVEIQTIEAEIKKPIYDSIQFPSGYGKEYNPI